MKFAKLRASSHPQAQFLWAIFRDLFHYCAVHLAEIADNARDVDLALRWGFGWSMGPFEIWQAAGWKEIAGYLADDILNGRTLASVQLPAWVTSGPAAEGVHTPAGAYSAAANAFRPRSSLPVYRRQYFPDPVLGEKLPSGTTIMETPAVRMWHLGDDIGIVSFKSKGNTIGEDVLDGLNAAIERAERECAGLVLWQTREPFSLGANLAAIGPAGGAGHWDVIEAVVAKFQQTSLRLRHSLIPTVAAVRGMALGGVCEFILHCDRTVAALESYIGLVEVGVGLLPGGGGCKELALRAVAESARGAVGGQMDQFPFIRDRISSPWRWRRCRGARSKRRSMGYLRRADVVVFNALRAPVRRQGPGAGARGIRLPAAAARAQHPGRRAHRHRDAGAHAGQHAGRAASSRHTTSRSACASRASSAAARSTREASSTRSGCSISSAREFMALMRNPKTQERIAHTLKTGKPLRN